LLSAKADPNVYFKFEEALLYVKRIRARPSILASHNEALLTGHPARYNFTRVELKTFTFGSGSKSLSIDNGILGVLPKRLIVTLIRNTDFLGQANTNSFRLRHYDLNSFAMYVNGRQIPAEGMSLDMSQEKDCTYGLSHAL
jgi:hypothetical protein